MGYARLERLTDAITFHVFEKELQSAPAKDRPSFVKCYPYITGFIKIAINPSVSGEELVMFAKFIAQEMIHDGQKFKGPALPSETGISIGATSQE